MTLDICVLQQRFGWCSPATAQLLSARVWSCCDTLLNAHTQTVKTHLFIAPQPVHAAPAACTMASSARAKANRPPQGPLVVKLPCLGLLELLHEPSMQGLQLWVCGLLTMQVRYQEKGVQTAQNAGEKQGCRLQAAHKAQLWR